jgi:hypothetical protein
MMADFSSTTRLFVGKDVLQSPPGDRFLRAVQRAVAGDFEVLGELGRGAKGKIVYLARETASKHLVALQLLPDEKGPEAGEMWLDVLRKLDGSVPSADGTCPRCGQVTRGWGRFCSQCGADLSGVAPGSGANTSVDRLLDAVKNAAGERYEVLGQMDRTEGGGVVYFARDKEGGNIVALRLQKDAPAADGRERYNLGQTVMLKSMVSSLLRDDQAEKLEVEAAAAPPPPPVPSAPKPAAAAPGRVSQERLVAYGLGAAALLLLVLFALWTSRGRQGAETAVVADTVPPPALADSAELQLGGSLPPRAVATVDGRTVSGGTVRLPPGTYVVKVTAPGFTAVEQKIELKPGQTMLWTPPLAKGGPSDRPKPAAPPPPRPQAPAPPRPQPPRPAVVDTSPLAINQPLPPTVRESVPSGPTATVGATCASLFSGLEWSRALTACQREAGQGGTAAQRTLGTMYERGLATEANPVEAGRWYAKAAESGDRFAQYRLGVLLGGGRGVKKDEKAAFKWFQRSADQGQVDAQLALAQAYDRGQGVKRSRTTAATWYLKAAASGKADAQFRLGEFYAKGEAGLPKSEVEARKWYKLAADQGHKEARKKLD